MRKAEEDLVLALYDAKRLISFLKTENEDPDEIEINIDQILEKYSILRFSCDNYKQIKKKEGNSILSTMPSFVLHKAFKDNEKHRMSSKEFKKLALEKTGWKDEDCEFDYTYVHLSKKNEKNQKKNRELLFTSMKKATNNVRKSFDIIAEATKNLTPKQKEWMLSEANNLSTLNKN